MAQRSPLPTNIHGCRQILGGTHARKRRADSRCRNSLAQFFLSAGGSIRVSAVVNCYRARFVVDRFKFYLLQIQDDVGYVLNDPGEGSKLVLRPSNPNGSNSSSFQRRQKNSAQRVANGVAIPCLKRFGDEFGVGFSCASLIFSEAFRHLETS